MIFSFKGVIHIKIKLLSKILIVVTVVVFFATYTLSASAAVFNQVDYGYTANPRVYGLQVDDQGQTIGETAIPFTPTVEGNYVSVKFGSGQDYRGFKVLLDSNSNVDLTTNTLYNIHGTVQLYLPQSWIYIPNHLVCYLGVGTDIIRSYSGEELAQIISGNVISILIDETFDATSFDTISNLTFYFYYPYNEIVYSPYLVHVTRFQITPTLGEDFANVRYDRNSAVIDSGGASYNFSQTYSTNGTLFKIDGINAGSSFEYRPFALQTEASRHFQLIKGFGYQLNGTITIKLPYGQWNFGNIQIVLGDDVNLVFDHNYLEQHLVNEVMFGELLQEGQLSFSINTAFICTDSHPTLDIYFNFMATASDWSTTPIEILVSPLEFKYNNRLSSDYVHFDDLNKSYLDDFNDIVGDLNSFNNDNYSFLATLSPGFTFIGDVAATLFYEIPFLKSIMIFSFSVGLGAFLLGVVPSTIKGVALSLRFKSNNKKGD